MIGGHPELRQSAVGRRFGNTSIGAKSARGPTNAPTVSWNWRWP